jgi:predicted ester cyclase
MLRRSPLLLLLVFLSLPAIADEEQNINTVRTMVELINQRDLDSLRTVVAENIVRHSAATPGVVVSNLDEFIAFLETDIAGVPDSVQTIDIAFGSGDKVAVRAHYRGTHTGPMGPFAATGKPIDLPFMAILRIENNKVAEIWVEWDNMLILGQLGLLPSPAE